ncbi:MAG: hypothetical protein AAF607_09690 [Pseudomonadota bacterium]
MQHCVFISVLALGLAAPAQASSLNVSGTKCGSTAFIGNIDLTAPPTLRSKQPSVLERQRPADAQPENPSPTSSGTARAQQGAIALLPIEALLPALQSGGDASAATPTAYVGAVKAFGQPKTSADYNEDCAVPPAP